MTLPTNVASGDPGHIDAHEEIHSVVGINLPTTLSAGNTAHRAWHERLHRVIPGLPTDLVGKTSADHISYHNTIHTWTNAQSPVGIRGTVGPRSPASIPEYPQSGLVSISPGAGTIQSAITANGDGTKFQLQAGTYSISSTLSPKAGQEFWGASGVTISGGGARERGVLDPGSVDGVKWMNITWSGFTGGTFNNRAAIWQPRPGASANWEIAYNEFSGDVVNTRYGVATGSGNTWVHHNYLHDYKEGAINGDESNGSVTEDNEITAAGATNGQKWLRMNNHVIRHNWIHDMNGTSIWYDTNNLDCIVEWNLVEDGPENGIEIEISGQITGTKNIVRFNTIRNHGVTGLFCSSSERMEAYGNTLTTNGLTTFIGDAPELQMFIKQIAINDGYDLANNYFHDNVVNCRVDGANAKAAQMNFQVSDPPSNTTPYLTNTKNNVFDYNIYTLHSLTDNHFRWGTTSEAWAAWQTEPTPTGTQDIHSTASI